MRARLVPRVAVTAVALELAAAALMVTVPGIAGLVAAAAVVCWLVFTLWPSTVLPIGIIGGTVAAASIGQGTVRGVVAMHMVILATGCAAVVTRRFLVADGEDHCPTAADGAMLALAGLTAVGVVYGLAVGNAPKNVVVTGYQIAVIPAYFFLATHTLTTERRMRTAGAVYVATAVVVTAASLATPGRHGGLVSLVAVPPLMVLAGRTRGWRRTGLTLLAAVLLVDVALAAYRGIWLAAGLSVMVLLSRGGPVVRRGMGRVAAAAGVLLVAALIVSAGVRTRSSVVGMQLHQSSGYRVSESPVGLGVFAHRPFFGAGLGQSVPDVYLTGLTVTDVGPIYHAFYVTILANAGLVGMLAVAWPVLRSIPAGLADRDGMGLAYASLTIGFLAAAVFAGPTDGHWELGLLPALTLLRDDPTLARRLSASGTTRAAQFSWDRIAERMCRVRERLTPPPPRPAQPQPLAPSAAPAARPAESPALHTDPRHPSDDGHATHPPTPHRPGGGTERR
jgi:hypothetical protein